MKFKQRGGETSTDLSNDGNEDDYKTTWQKSPSERSVGDNSSWSGSMKRPFLALKHSYEEKKKEVAERNKYLNLFSHAIVFKIFSRELQRSKDWNFKESSFQADLKRLNRIAHGIGIDDGNHVRFANVEIREYPIIAGENPGVSKGVPLSMDWAHICISTNSVDNYEGIRQGNRRSVPQMRRSSGQRIDLLLKLGFARADIQNASRAATLLRYNRRNTLSSIAYVQFHYKMECLKRGLLRVCTFGLYKREERKYLQKYAPKRRKIPIEVLEPEYAAPQSVGDEV